MDLGTYASKITTYHSRIQYLTDHCLACWNPANNQLGGTLPTELGLLNKLRVLSIGESLSFSMGPRSIKILTPLPATLWIANNYLTGVLPRGLGSLTQLLMLNLGKGSGRVQVWRVLLSELRLTPNHVIAVWFVGDPTCLIERNFLSGTLPTELGLMTALNRLVLCEYRGERG